jgi:hypothetical protein
VESGCAVWWWVELVVAVGGLGVGGLFGRVEDVGREEGLVEEGGCCGPLSVLEVWSGRRRSTFHDARFVDCELESYVADLDVCFGGEGDAAEEQVQLSRRAGHCREDWGPFLGHGAMLCLYVVFVVRVPQ